MKARSVLFISLVVVAFVVVQQFKGKQNPGAGARLLAPELERAENEGKVVMLMFSGSDWCGYCIRLEHDVLGRDEFKKFADENLVMVLADFPENKKGMSEELQNRNNALAKAYPHQGVPSIFFLDSKGRPIAQAGYKDCGPEEYIEYVRRLIGR